MRNLFALTVVGIFISPPLTAAPRNWKSADGVLTLKGEYVSHDDKNITLKLEGKRTVTLALTKFHPQEIAWLEKNHPAATPKAPPPDAVFDHLQFGDTRAEVLEKLTHSKAVESTLDMQFIARVGLNGVFRTKQKIGGKTACLFFDWTPQGTLSEISLQTDVHPAGDYESALKPCWVALSELLTNLHGNPRIAANLPALNEIAEDSLIASHVWDLKPEGSLLLGTAHQSGGYLIVARFCKSE